jgi:hypothetical protein
MWLKETLLKMLKYQLLTKKFVACMFTLVRELVSFLC